MKSLIFLTLIFAYVYAQNYRTGFCVPVTGRMTQGPNGRYSHSSGVNQWAYDYACPIGTPIYAMKAGKVADFRDIYPDTGGGYAQASKFNFVRIEHPEGVSSLYIHLQQNWLRRLPLRKGQQVAVGQIIGYSGNSGWSTGPHLHVQVQTGAAFQSIPYKMDRGLCKPSTANPTTARPTTARPTTARPTTSAPMRSCSYSGRVYQHNQRLNYQNKAWYRCNNGRWNYIGPIATTRAPTTRAPTTRAPTTRAPSSFKSQVWNAINNKVRSYGKSRNFYSNSALNTISQRGAVNYSNSVNVNLNNDMGRAGFGRYHYARYYWTPNTSISHIMNFASGALRQFTGYQYMSVGIQSKGSYNYFFMIFANKQNAVAALEIDESDLSNLELME